MIILPRRAARLSSYKNPDGPRANLERYTSSIKFNIEREIIALPLVKETLIEYRENSYKCQIKQALID